MLTPALLPPPKPLIILGSARSDGDTRRLLEAVLAEVPHTLIDLLNWPLAPYSYTHTYPAADSFLRLADLVLQHSVIVFATPIYWYSMSGVLKNFFDRLTDLTTIYKPLGRQLAGKHVFLLAVGSDPELPSGFEMPFKLTANYFTMSFEGSFYQSTKQPFARAEAKQFASRILSTLAALPSPP